VTSRVVVLRLKRRFVLVDEAEIDCIDGARNYVKINIGPTSLRVRSPLGEIERALPAERFLRLQRSTIVNLGAVRELVRGPYGDLAAVLANGRRLTVGRAYRRKLLAALARAPSP
jgi:two-component system LytT family response regulator